jgi:hypothetical protein
MFSIAYVVSQNQMRRSLVGALATDPVMPECRRRTRRSTRRTPVAKQGAQDV